ncbi:MAG: TRAP transporter large permease [Alphaproteobacteria bacterium]|nr:TRAP transporter large permease [Alphaproteobacteria bacterium]
MTWHLALLAYGVVLAALLLGGVTIGAAMGIVGILGITLVAGTGLWSSLGDIVFNTTTSFTLVSVPLFVLMGEVILRSGLSKQFYAGVSGLLAPVPAALAHSNIVGCSIFAALCGSSVATALTIGTVALPEMRARGYADKLTLGTLTGGGCLGILIPPSIPMVVYGSMTNESVLDLFMAGVVPGLILAGLFMGYVLVRVAVTPGLAPEARPSVTARGLAVAFLNVLPVTALIGLIFSGMYWGFVTPTEAAAFGSALALVLGLTLGELRPPAMWTALSNTVVTTCIVMFITINAQFLSFAVVQSGIGRGVANAMVSSGLGPFVFFCLLYLMYLVLGMFLDGLSLMLLTVPILYPAMTALGFDGIWIGVVMIIFIELGALTPPMGLNLFAIQTISRQTPLGQIARAALPYAVIISLFSFVLYFLPDIALFLPRTMRGG